jgi:hypothetical protein
MGVIVLLTDAKKVDGLAPRSLVSSSNISAACSIAANSERCLLGSIVERKVQSPSAFFL